MKKTIFGNLPLLTLAILLVTVVPASAQTDEPQAPAQGDSQDKDKTKSEDDEEPGKGKLSAFGESLAKFWSVRTAFQGTQSFDDNVFSANSFRKSDTVTKLSGRITAAYRGQHTRFEASYMPEFNLYQRYEPLNYTAHNYFQTFNHDFSRRLEMHWNLTAYRAPSRGNLPFKVVNFGGFRFNMYSVEALNDGLNLFYGSNNVGMSYRWSPRLKVLGSMEGVVTHFTKRGNPAISPVSSEFIYSAGGKLGFEYSLNPRQTVGVTVGHTYFGSVLAEGIIGPNEHQNYQTARLTYSHKLPNRFNLVASVGPGFTHRQGANAVDVSTFFDLGISRQLARSGFAVTFQRSTQVGLLQTSISGYSVNARANRNFGRKWISNIGGSYQRSEGAGGIHQLESYSGNAQIGYRLTGSITPFINYGHTRQKALVPNPATRDVTRNEVAIGFVYNFGVIAGR